MKAFEKYAMAHLLQQAEHVQKRIPDHTKRVGMTMVGGGIGALLAAKHLGPEMENAFVRKLIREGTDSVAGDLSGNISAMPLHFSDGRRLFDHMGLESYELENMPHNMLANKIKRELMSNPDAAGGLGRAYQGYRPVTSLLGAGGGMYAGHQVGARISDDYNAQHPSRMDRIQKFLNQR